MRLQEEGQPDSVARVPINNRKQFYHLQTGDVLHISIITQDYSELANLKEETEKKNGLLEGYVIDQKGNITLPVMGAVQVRGKTLPQVRENLNQLLEEYFKYATAKVSLLSFKVYLFGAVQKPGELQVRSEKFTVVQALLKAGYIGEFGDLTKVRLVRPEESELKVAYLDLTSEKALTSDYYYLKPGDMIYVHTQRGPKRTSKFFKENYPIVISTLGTLALVARVFFIID